MTVSQFDFGQWLPDNADLANPGLTIAENVLPVGSGYEPISDAVAIGAQITGRARGAIRIIRPDGSQVIAIGTENALVTVIGGILTSTPISPAVSSWFWSFVPFGRMLWAFAPNMPPYYIQDITTGTTFFPHPGQAPQAATAARIGDFIVAGNLFDVTSEQDPYRIRWSRFNDPAGDWDDETATQGGAVDMPIQNGPVVAVAGGNFGIIMQRYGIARLEYTGGATVFSKVEVSTGRGCAAPQSVVQVAGVTYFLSDDGFFKTDGTAPTPIASNRIWDWFQSACNPGSFEEVQGAIDWRARCIIWSFSSAESAGDTYDRQVIYSWETDRWTSGLILHEWMFDTIKSGMTLEQVSVSYPDLDAMPVSLDSGQFKARGRSLTCIKGRYLCELVGATMRATVETGELQPAAGYRCFVSGVSVLAQNADENSVVRLGARDTFKGDSIRWTDDHAEGGDGMAHPVIDGRYVRCRVSIPAGANWQKLTGVQVEYVRTGRK